MDESSVGLGVPTVINQLVPIIPTIRRGHLTFRNHHHYQASSSGDTKSGALVRKDHTKSRRGCYSCKKRRVKCPENHPICTQCYRRGLKCEWPEFHILQAGGATKTSLSISKQVDLPTPIFTAQDFRLFHHFIQGGYPNKPIESASVWTHEVPSIAHNHNYLLHAMLALSATHIEASSSQHCSELVQSAMYHRLQAIRGLNYALSTGLDTCEEGNAVLATTYILVFQSTLMDDGLAEYLTFIRGIVLISLQMGFKGLKFLFNNMISNEGLEDLRPYFQSTPDPDLGPVDAAYASLKKIKPLCERKPEKVLHACLLLIVRNLYTSPLEAYMAWMKAGGLFSFHINEADFQALIHPSNPLGQLLQSHLIAIHTFLTPVGLGFQISKDELQTAGCLIRWLDILQANIGPEMRTYNEWPMKRTEDFREWYLREKSVGLTLSLP